jgi:hypothetical protein
VDDREQGEICVIAVLELVQFDLRLPKQGIVGPGMLGKPENHPSVVIHGLQGVGLEHGNLGHLVIDPAEIVQGFRGVRALRIPGIGMLKTILDRIPIGTILGLAGIFEKIIKSTPPFFELLG